MKKLAEVTAERVDRLEKLSEELERNPMVIEIRKAEAEQTQAERVQAVARIAELNRELEAMSAGPILGLQVKLAGLDAERKKLQQEMDAERVRMLQRKASLEGRIRREQDFLCGSYDPKIDEAIEFFQKRLAEFREPGKTSIQRVGGRKNLFTERKEIKLESNRKALLSAISFCQDAIRRLEVMKLEAVFDPEEIEKMKSEIPDISVYEEIEGVKEFKGLGAPMVHQQPDLLDRLGLR